MVLIDLKLAFDSIDRSHLWEKLVRAVIALRLLSLLRARTSQMVAKGRIGQRGELTDPISLIKGVHQICLLAPFLFHVVYWPLSYLH